MIQMEKCIKPDDSILSNLLDDLTAATLNRKMEAMTSCEITCDG